METERGTTQEFNRFPFVRDFHEIQPVFPEADFGLGITVAVGTTIADRPPHRSVRARLRIRLLRRMSGVEACIGIGVQNAGWRNPPVQDWGKTFPTHLCALTAADQNTLP